MPTIIFIGHDGRRWEAQAEVGTNIMNAASSNNVPGILADCGGEGICGTCQGYVDEHWMDRLPAPSSYEAEMLEAGVANPRPTSRLTCQISMTEALDGIVIGIPKSQV
jgi:ferredoxin, 2Fe-2S